MKYINTALGTVPVDEMGVTLMHEHLTIRSSGWESDALAAYDVAAITAKCAEALGEAKPYGVKTMINASPADLGRDVDLTRRVSERTGINIILVTGLYTEEAGASAYFKSRSQMHDVAAEMHETFVKEITQGIGKTGVKAGAIKVATGHGHITPYEEMALKAAARAQKETGVPIITHTDAGTMGPEQADLLISEGANPKQIVIGHMCGNSDLKYHISVLEKGVSIAFDRLGLEFLGPDTVRKALIIGLLGIGHANRIMLSHDHLTCSIGRPSDNPDLIKTIMPNWSYAHVFRNIIPALKASGVKDDQISTMMVNNPQRLFAGG